MVNQGTLRIAFETPADAARAAAALSPDDEGAVDHHLEGTTLVVEAEGASMLGLLRSLDDVMTCLRVLEGADPAGVSMDRRRH